jgi:hypothetical protein
MIAKTPVLALGRAGSVARFRAFEPVVLKRKTDAARIVADVAGPRAVRFVARRDDFSVQGPARTSTSLRQDQMSVSARFARHPSTCSERASRCSGLFS